jgi:hypothetical protein
MDRYDLQCFRNGKFYYRRRFGGDTMTDETAISKAEEFFLKEKTALKLEETFEVRLRLEARLIGCFSKSAEPKTLGAAV